MAETRTESDEPVTALWVMYLYSFIRIVRIAIDWVVDCFFSLIFDRNPKAVIPPLKKPFLAFSGTKLAKLIRTKQLTSEEVVSAYIQRCQEINSALNAIVDDRFDDALEDARNVDKFLASTDMKESELATAKPFLGVPFTSKESTEAKGMAFTFGLVSRKKRNAKGVEDSVVVDLLKKSGAILIGVSNVPELNLWCETRNNVYGQTGNPYDTRRTTGGSSGGEASILAACGSAIGIGTDIGGSTRMPAYYCGIFGHKPTADLVSTKGLTFRTGTETTTMVAAGPMSRHAEDLAPFLSVLLGEKRNKLKLNDSVDMKKLKVYYICEPADIKVSSVCDDNVLAIERAAEYLSTLTGNPAEEVDLPGFQYSQSIWRHWMTKEGTNFAFDVGNREKDVSLALELPKFLMCQSDHTLPIIMRLLDLHLLPQTNVEWAEKESSVLLEKIKKLLGNDGVLLFPGGPREAPYHYESILRPYNFAYWAIFNALKIPATAVPMGLSNNGLPIGLQVVAGPYNDHLCLAVARELEQQFGGWVPPFVSS